MRIFRNLLVSVSLVPAIGSAQATNADAPLEIPRQARVLCHGNAPDTTALPKAHPIHMRFDFGATPGVEGPLIDVSFDSAGRPISLTELLPMSVPRKTVTIYSVVVRFQSTGAVEGMIIKHESEWRNPKKPGAPTTRSISPLTDVEKASARTLAQWLWDRRCTARARQARDSA